MIGPAEKSGICAAGVGAQGQIPSDIFTILTDLQILFIVDNPGMAFVAHVTRNCHMVFSSCIRRMESVLSPVVPSSIACG